MPADVWLVRYAGEYPKKKVIQHDGVFSSRRKARRFCRNHQIEFDNLQIIHPDGSYEPFKSKT